MLKLHRTSAEKGLEQEPSQEGNHRQVELNYSITFFSGEQGQVNTNETVQTSQSSVNKECKTQDGASKVGQDSRSQQHLHPFSLSEAHPFKTCPFLDESFGSVGDRASNVLKI